MASLAVVNMGNVPSTTLAFVSQDTLVISAITHVSKKKNNKKKHFHKQILLQW